jgi:uncharacterized protein (TIGR02678 family)
MNPFGSLGAHEQSEAQRAVRLLLALGFVTPARAKAEDFERLRRLAPLVGPALREATGWTLHSSRHALRLERRLDAESLTAQDGWPGELGEGDARRLSLFALLLAALERTGDQVVLSELAEAVAASGRRAQVAFDPNLHLDRRHFVQVLRAALSLGLLTEHEGKVEGWQEQGGEALLDIQTEALRLFFRPPIPLHRVTDPRELLAPPILADSREGPRRRQRLLRRLLSEPVLYVEDLDAADRSYLRAEGKEIAALAEALTGGVVERRAEGLALVYTRPTSGLLLLPETGGHSVAALALAAHLQAIASELPKVNRPPPGAALPGAPTAAPVGTALPFADDATLMSLALRICNGLGEALPAELREPQTLLRRAQSRLADHGLVRPCPGGLALLPALARFRAAPIEPSAPAAPAAAQTGLFGAPNPPPPRTRRR